MGSTVRFRSARLRTTTARRATAEIDVSVAMVTTDAARSVSLLALPAAERLAPVAQMHARRAGVRCRVERSTTGSVVLSFTASPAR